MKKEAKGNLNVQKIEVYKHEHPFVKFLIVFLLFLIYFGFSAFKFGFTEGLLISLLTWSFFVFCTPIVGAGLLLDFPVRFLTGIKMIYSELIVWIIAAILNLITLLKYVAIYEKSIILILFKNILINPFPYWAIILLSGLGTFLSVFFGDEILDLLTRKKRKRKNFEKHDSKYRIIIFLSIIGLIIGVYSLLLKKLGISIPLF